jgi:hypothetical protein
MAEARERRAQGAIVALPEALGVHTWDMLAGVDQAAARRVSKAYALATRSWPRRICVAASAVDPESDTVFTDARRDLRIAIATESTAIRSGRLAEAAAPREESLRLE